MFDRITNFNQSKKLKMLGVSQCLGKYDYFYTEHNDMKKLCFYREQSANQIIALNLSENYIDHHIALTDVQCKAFDGVQIDEMLPNIIESNKVNYKLDIDIFNDCICIGYFNYHTNKYLGEKENEENTGIRVTGETKLEVKANLLIKLLEKGIIRV